MTRKRAKKDDGASGVGVKQREKGLAGEHIRGRGAGETRVSVAQRPGRCRICQHPEREEIEREFLDWVSPRETAERWKLASYRSIYRHAHAAGLVQLRRENRQAALDCIIERVGEVTVKASAVVAAIRLSAKLDSYSAEVTADGGLREGPGFVLSLEGLPRTDAVTGHVGREGFGFAKEMEGGDSAGGWSVEAAAGGEKGARTRVSAPLGALPGPEEADPASPRLWRTIEYPRVVFGEDGGCGDFLAEGEDCVCAEGALAT